MQLVRKSGEIGVQLQWFWNTITMVLGRKRLFIEKQGDNTKKENKGSKLLKTIFMELLWNRTRRRNKKEQIQMSLFFHSNAVCIVLWRYKIKREVPALNRIKTISVFIFLPIFAKRLLLIKLKKRIFLSFIHALYHTILLTY